MRSMGLLDFFRRKGGTEPGEGGERDTSQAEPGLSAEGPPVGASDPGALAGDDVAGEDVLGADADRVDR